MTSFITSGMSDYLCSVKCDYVESNPLNAANIFLRSLQQSKAWEITVVDQQTNQTYLVNIPNQTVVEVK
jgi:hypothetical protein